MIQSHEYLEAFRVPTERLVKRIFQIVLKITCEFANWERLFGRLRLLCTTSGQIAWWL
jgi:hypothetical protein